MKILVIGELCEDRFIYGDSKRLSPEAPVPIFVPHRVTSNPGMGGNVVQNILSLEPGTEVQHLHQDDIITKTRYVDEKSNHMFLRVDEGDHIVKPFYLTDKVKNQISGADAVIISDYNKGFLTEHDILQIIRTAKLSFIDTKKKLKEGVLISQTSTFMKLNEEEYNRNKAYLYHDKVIITLGARGAMYMDTVYPSPAPLQTMDVSGAGDTFIAAFTMSYMTSNDVAKAIRYANEMCSIVVAKKGVAVPINR